MKKVLIGWVLALSTLSLQAATVNWGYTSDLSSGYNAGWLVQMYQDVDGDSTLGSLLFDTVAADGTFTAAGNGDDDILLAATTFLADSKGSPPVIWSVPTQSVGDDIDVYTVIFNQASVGGMGIIVDSSVFTTPDGGVGSYLQGSVNGSWQAVPEPATALLFGIGGMGAWVVRRNKRKAQEEEA